MMFFKTNISTFLIVFLVLSTFSCAGAKIMERRDNLGRTVRISYYERGDLEHVEEIKYVDNSFNPRKVEYRYYNGSRWVVRKEEKYYYRDNNLFRLAFFVHKKDEIEQTGSIVYRYSGTRPLRIEYYKNGPGGDYLMALDQYTYEGRSLDQRRLIEYEINPETGRRMQVGQYVIQYEKGEPQVIRSWVLDKKTKKIIEKKEERKQEVKEIIQRLEERFLHTCKGPEFTAI